MHQKESKLSEKLVMNHHISANTKFLIKYFILTHTTNILKVLWETSQISNARQIICFCFSKRNRRKRFQQPNILTTAVHVPMTKIRYFLPKREWAVQCLQNTSEIFERRHSTPNWTTEKVQKMNDPTSQYDWYTFTFLFETHMAVTVL